MNGPDVLICAVLFYCKYFANEEGVEEPKNNGIIFACWSPTLRKLVQIFYFVISFCLLFTSLVKKWIADLGQNSETQKIRHLSLYEMFGTMAQVENIIEICKSFSNPNPKEMCLPHLWCWLFAFFTLKIIVLLSI